MNSGSLKMVPEPAAVGTQQSTVPLCFSIKLGGKTGFGRSTLRAGDVCDGDSYNTI